MNDYYGGIKYKPDLNALPLFSSGTGIQAPSGGMLKGPTAMSAPNLTGGVSAVTDNLGGSVMSSIGGFLANPITGVAVTAIDLVSRGINWWINKKEQEKAEKKAEAERVRVMRMENARFEKEMERFGINKKTWLENLKNSRLDRKNQMMLQNKSMIDQSVMSIFNGVNADEQRRNRFASMWR